MKKKTKLALAIMGTLCMATQAVAPITMAAAVSPVSTPTLAEKFESKGFGQSNIELLVKAGELTITNRISNLFLTSDGNADNDNHTNSRTPEFYDQEVYGTFQINGEGTNAQYPFEVEDLKGSDRGYYTTIQVSPLYRDGTSSDYDIDATMVGLKTAGATLITGATNPAVKINKDFETRHKFNEPTTYFYRTETEGLLGRYGDAPTVYVTIPANTPAGAYKGTIYYTLYDGTDSDYSFTAPAA